MDFADGDLVYILLLHGNAGRYVVYSLNLVLIVLSDGIARVYVEYFHIGIDAFREATSIGTCCGKDEQ